MYIEEAAGISRPASSMTSPDTPTPSCRAASHPILQSRHRHAMIQILALLGASLILLPFAASQLGHLAVESRRYQALNLAGSAVLTVAAVVQRQYGFIVLEAVWALMSAIGLARVVRRGQAA